MSNVSALIQQSPKTETHLHLEGALPLHLARKLDPVVFAEPPPYWADDFRYHDFGVFQEQFDRHFFYWFNSPERYFESCSAVFTRLREENCVYVEASFHLGMAEHVQPFREVARAIHAAKPDGLELRLFLGMFRDHYHGVLAETVDEAVGWDEIAGVDLHGFERPEFQPWSVDVWARVRSLGKVVKAHAGEFSSAEDVRQAVMDLGVRRVQHGLRAIDDPAVMNLLREEDVTLDLTPISNVKLGAVPSLRQHPLRQFLDAGIRCTVSTDDPMLFGNTLVQEYEWLSRDGGFTPEELVGLIKNGFEVADLDAGTRDAYLREVEEVYRRWSQDA